MKPAAAPTDAPPLLTRAEESDFRETSRHKEVLAFCDELARRTDLCHRTSMGQSGEGQDLAVLVLSDNGCFTAEEARKQKKAVVMIQANIHAGEVEGKEAVLALARDLTIGRRGKKILSKICLVLIPDLNPDGNDRISPAHRRLDMEHLEGQVGPEGGVGTRYTGQGWNLNRDAMKQEAPETRCQARLLQQFFPHVFVDCHTTDGSIHGFDLTFDTGRNNQALFSRLHAFTRGMLERISRRVDRDHGFQSYWYGNFVDENDPTSGWHTYPALPRFGSHYRGLLGRIDVLLETYSYLDFRRRYEVIYAWLDEIVRYAAKNNRTVRRQAERAEARIVRLGQHPDPRPLVGVNYGVARRGEDRALLFDYPAYAVGGDEARIVSFDRESIAARRYPGNEPAIYKAPHHRTFIPTEAVSLPAAYLAPPELAERLAGHGVAASPLGREAELEVESYLVLAIDKTHSPDVAGTVLPLEQMGQEGAAEAPLSSKPPPQRFETVLTVRAERRRVTFPPETLVVRTAQRAGVLAAYLLEPHSDDGLARWEFLDSHLRAGELFPVHRVLRLEHMAAPEGPPATET